MRTLIIMGLLVLIGFVFLAIGYTAEQASMRQEAENARLASQDFARTLKQQLLVAMRTQGPGGAIAICQTIAPQISRQYSSDGLQIRRTALKLRNPANAPDAWERDVLTGFEAAMKKGADPETLERYGFFSNKNGGKTFRYMKAIAVTTPCLACHGKAISPAVQSVLAERYPDDQATGFAIGDLRGAFTIRKQMTSR